VATTITTNSALGLGYQTGIFSGPLGENLNQTFFDAAFAGQINTNKIYKSSYHCNIIQDCGMSQWLEEFMGYDTDCHPAYSLIETYNYKNQITVQTNVTINAYPATGVIEMLPADAYSANAYVLPQVGNILIFPTGAMGKVTAIGTASAADPKITVQLLPGVAAQVLLAGDKLYVVSGSEIADCACPAGQFAVPDMPIVTDLNMFNFGDKGQVCGDAIDKCQWLKIPFTDECGNVINAWYTEALQLMYQRHEKAKFYQRLLNPNFGIIPIVKARGWKWTPNSTTEIVEEDFRTLSNLLDQQGVGCHEFAIFAGRNLFSQFQRIFNTLAKSNLQYSERPLNECAWINLEYCGIKVEGLTLHVYKDCMFSNGKELGGPNSVFPGSAIIVPMCNRPACRRGNGTDRGDAGGRDMKMYSTVYFRSDATGQVFDNLTDSNGIFGPRNTFGTGCREHQWSIQSRFLGEVHCANWWGFMGL
jgi:hypothetical protein